MMISGRIFLGPTAAVLIFGCRTGVTPRGARPFEPADKLKESQAACIDAVLTEWDAWAIEIRRGRR